MKPHFAQSCTFSACLLLACVALLLAGCSGTPTELEAKTTPVVQSYAENYQGIYRRVSSTAKRCAAGNVGAYASIAVDAELYPDLGYGEVTGSLINYGVRNYYWRAKIERVEQPSPGKAKPTDGARLTVSSGNTLAARTQEQTLFRWASGDENCFEAANTSQKRV